MDKHEARANPSFAESLELDRRHGARRIKPRVVAANEDLQKTRNAISFLFFPISNFQLNQ